MLLNNHQIKRNKSYNVLKMVLIELDKFFYNRKCFRVSARITADPAAHPAFVFVYK